MIEIRRTFDYELLSAIANQPENYRRTRDDLSPPLGEYRAPATDQIYYLLVSDKEKDVLGFGAFIPSNPVCYEAHVAFLPVAWGRTEDCCKGMFRWMWKYTPARKITGSIAEFNRLAIKLAQRSGMKMEGINFKSFLKDGQLHDQILLGISKP